MSALPRRLDHMTTLEAADAVRRRPVVVLPAGALEQHGPGLPLGTDTIRAERLVERLVDELPESLVVGPTIPVGVSPHHLPFAGTLTLRTATFAAVVTEYVTGLHRHGWRKILIVTGHGGNAAALGTVVQDLLVTHPDLELAWSGITGLARDAVRDMDVSEVHGHSGEAETAQMLALAPELVHTDRLVAGTTELDQLEGLPRLTRVGQPHVTVTWDRLSERGVLGDPTRATVDHGRAVLDEALSRLVHFVKGWLDA